jgi:two-component system, LytTR family, response regulator LytT
MVRIAVCDIDTRRLDELSLALDRHLKTRNVHSDVICFSKGWLIEDYLSNIKGCIDLLIIDAFLGEESGVRIAKEIKREYPRIKVIFMSDRVADVYGIFEAEPIYYLHKPTLARMLPNALDIALSAIQRDAPRILSVTSRGQIHNVLIDFIEYVESDKRILMFHEPQRTLEIYAQLDDIEKKLTLNFIRCHQSFLVNLFHIRTFASSEITLLSGMKIPVAKKRYAAAKEHYNRFLGF